MLIDNPNYYTKLQKKEGNTKENFGTFNKKSYN